MVALSQRAVISLSAREITSLLLAFMTMPPTALGKGLPKLFAGQSSKVLIPCHPDRFLEATVPFSSGLQ